MKATKNIARLAVTAGLTAALSFGGVMAPVTMAFAADGSTVTFDDAYASTTTYKGIQIFKATVTTTAEGATTVSNIDWGSNDVKTAVMDAIQEIEPSYISKNAQDAADWLNNNNKGTNATDTNTKVDSDHVLNTIAAKLKNSNQWKVANNGPSLDGLDAGYWLFLTDAVDDAATEKPTDTFSSPVYAIIDGTNTTVKITPKKSVPTVEKKILDDSAARDNLSYTKQSGWGDVADSQIGQEVNYKLTGTIADNYATYDSYAYKFTDVLSNGLDYVDGSVEVYAFDGTSYTMINAGKYDAKCDGKTLTVEFKVGEGKNGLKDVDGVTAGTQIVVFYKAKLNSDAVIGNAKDESANPKKGGNPNTVTLEYSNNPHAQGTGKTVGHTVADFAFRLNLKKVDQGTEKGLEGAVFTIQSADTNTMDKYVASAAGEFGGSKVVAGQLVDVPSGTSVENLPDCVKFKSDNNGMITSSGLDAGSYKVTEIKAPGSNNEYTAAEHFIFTITPEYSTDGTMNVEKIDSSLDPSRSDVVLGELDETPGDNKLNVKDGSATNPVDGVINITVGNTKQIKLPLTGLNGVTLTWIAGGAVLCIGVAHLIRSRKRDDGSEE